MNKSNFVAGSNRSERTILSEAYGIEWVTGGRLAELTGHTVKALDRKRQRGIFRAGNHYRMVDGKIHYSVKAYNEWASGQTTQESNSTEENFGSVLRIRARGGASR